LLSSWCQRYWSHTQPPQPPWQMFSWSSSACLPYMPYHNPLFAMYALSGCVAGSIASALTVLPVSFSTHTSGTNCSATGSPRSPFDRTPSRLYTNPKKSNTQSTRKHVVSGGWEERMCGQFCLCLCRCLSLHSDSGLERVQRISLEKAVSVCTTKMSRVVPADRADAR
jgi:hypothetical protein